MNVVEWLLDRMFALGQRRRHVKVLMHEAFFVGSTEPCYFVTVTNLSPERDVEITHIWFETRPQHHVLDPQLPKRLAPDELTWATWVPVANVPPTKRV